MGPRFLQDLEKLDGDLIPIEQLFINAVGAQGKSFNTDLFEKRDRIRVLSRPAARYASGRMATICVADLTADQDRDPVIEPAWGRAEVLRRVLTDVATSFAIEAY